MLHKHKTNKNHWTVQRVKKNKILKKKKPNKRPCSVSKALWQHHLSFPHPRLVRYKKRSEGKKNQPREEETSCYGGTEHVADESGTVFKETQASEALARSRLLHGALSLMSLPVKPGLCGCLSRSNHGPPLYPHPLAQLCLPLPKQLLTTQMNE